MNQPIKITCILALSLLINFGINASETSYNNCVDTNICSEQNNFANSNRVEHSEKQTRLIQTGETFEKIIELNRNNSPKYSYCSSSVSDDESDSDSDDESDSDSDDENLNILKLNKKLDIILSKKSKNTLENEANRRSSNNKETKNTYKKNEVKPLTIKFLEQIIHNPKSLQQLLNYNNKPTNEFHNLKKKSN